MSSCQPQRINYGRRGVRLHGSIQAAAAQQPNLQTAVAMVMHAIQVKVPACCCGDDNHSAARMETALST